MALILADAILTYIGVAHLGAYEVMLPFINQSPSLMWLVALAKILSLLFLVKVMKRRAWLEYVLYIVVAVHVVALANNACLLLWRLL
jgi:predicted membrane channel-forming protein YqfA (hemolysin III family)